MLDGPLGSYVGANVLCHIVQCLFSLLKLRSGVMNNVYNDNLQ